jgi:hypothetical protein
MFTKPSQEHAIDDHADIGIDACGNFMDDKMATLSIKDLRTIQSTRQILKKEIQGKKKSSTHKKVPLSIFITPKQDCSSNVTERYILDSISSAEDVNKTHIGTNSSRQIDVTSEHLSECENAISMYKESVSPPRTVNKRKSVVEISTQVSLASPVHSDVETLPADILETAGRYSASIELPESSGPKSAHIHDLEEPSCDASTEKRSPTEVNDFSTDRKFVDCGFRSISAKPAFKHCKSFPVLVTKSRLDKCREALMQQNFVQSLE